MSGEVNPSVPGSFRGGGTPSSLFSTEWGGLQVFFMPQSKGFHFDSDSGMNAFVILSES